MESKKKMDYQEKKHKNRVKYQLSIQRPSLTRIGLLNLSGLDITSLAELGTQKYLKILNISHTSLESLETLPSQPNMQQIIADDTQICSYVGLMRHPKLKSVSFLNTPIAEDDHKFRLTMLVLVGQMLSVINGVPVSAKERIEASKYPLIARNLIEANWEIQEPVPSAEDFRKLVVASGIRLRGVDSEFTNDEAQKYFSPPPQLVPIDTGKRKDIPSDDSDENIDSIDQDIDLQKQIYKELHSIGITVNKGPDMQKEIVLAVKGLADLVKNFESCYKEVFNIATDVQSEGYFEEEEEN